jgi:hypothetical protein
LLNDLDMKLFVALVLAAGCGASVNSTPINMAPHPMAPRPPATVELYTSGPPARPHVDVALLEVEESSSVSLADTSEMMNELRNRGAQMGCDGIVLGSSSTRDPGLGDAESWIAKNPRGRKGFTATCIAYTTDDMPVAQAPEAAPPAAAP